MSASLYSDLANYVKTLCPSTTFSLCSSFDAPDGSRVPLVSETKCSNVFDFDHGLVTVFYSSFNPGAADSIHFSKKSVNFVEFKGYSQSQYSTFSQFFNEANVFKQLDESLLFFENSFLPSFSAFAKTAISRQNLVINFYLVVDLAVCPLQIELSVISRISGIPTAPCISKYQKRDNKSNCCFYNRIFLLTPQLFDTGYFSQNP